MRLISRVLALAVISSIAGGGAASTLPLVNTSFETLPAGGLNYSDLFGATFSVNSPVAGWTSGFPAAPTLVAAGQASLGTPNNYYLNYVPDGAVVAYSNNGGTLYQNAGVVTFAGETFTLSLAMAGNRNDGVKETGQAFLTVFNHSTEASGVQPMQGNWSNYTASYTATAGDIGTDVGVFLQTPSYNGVFEQGLFDNVLLTSSAPEPEAWVLMVCGLGLVGGCRGPANFDDPARRSDRRTTSRDSMPPGAMRCLSAVESVISNVASSTRQGRRGK